MYSKKNLKRKRIKPLRRQREADKLGKSKKYREWRAEKQSKTCSDCKDKNTCPERSRDMVCTSFEERGGEKMNRNRHLSAKIPHTKLSKPEKREIRNRHKRYRRKERVLAYIMALIVLAVMGFGLMIRMMGGVL